MRVILAAGMIYIMSFEVLLGLPEGRPLQQVWRKKLCMSVCLYVCSQSLNEQEQTRLQLK